MTRRPSAATALVQIATIARAHGLKGHLMVNIDATMVSSATPGLEVRLESATLQPLVSKLIEARVSGNRMVWGLEALSDRTTAEAWAGAAVFIEPTALPDVGADEYFDFELLGAAVVDSVGTPLGAVREIVATGANDVLIVQGPRGEVLIPVTRIAILDVDTSRRRIIVDTRALVYEDDEDGREGS